MLSRSNLEDEKVLGQWTVYLTIEDYEGLSNCFVDDLSQLNNPTSLKSVSIEFCRGVEYILRSDHQGLPACEFPNTLKHIRLLSLDDLKGVMQRAEIGLAPSAAAQPAVFSSLIKLEIGYCKKIRRWDYRYWGFPTLNTFTFLSVKK